MFCLPFILLVGYEVHCLWFLFPLAIVVYILWNVYCIVQFNGILQKHFNESFPEDQTSVQSNVLNDEMKDLRFMRNLALLCCGISSITLTLFLSVHDVHILSILPTLWAITCVLHTLQFARNRLAVTESLLSVRIHLKLRWKRFLKAAA